jgi:hypothetical protein
MKHTSHSSSISFSVRTFVCMTSLALSAGVLAQDKAVTPPVTVPVATPATITPAVQTENLPAAAEILKKSVEAIGGKEAWSKVKSTEIIGAMEMPAAGMKGPVRSKMAPPNKMLTLIELAGVGTIRQGFDGTTAWSIDPINGARLLEGKELETMRHEADFLKEVDLEKRWDKIETVSGGDFNGYDCWKLVGTKGSDTTTLYYAKDDGLARGVEMEVDTQVGRLKVVTVIREYREFGAVRMPVRTEATQMNQKMVSTVESVVFDLVDPSEFDLPKEIKALLEPEPTEEEELENAATAPDAPAAPSAPAAPTTPVAPKTPAAPAAPKAPATPK